VSFIRNAALVLFAGALLPALAACSNETGTSAQGTATAAAKGELTVSNARVVLPPVAGNPAAVYFDLSYEGAPGVTLDSVDVEGAGMTMIHDYAENAGKMQMVMADALPLEEGAPISFAPGGLHVMAMDPSEELKAGGTAKVTLILSNGITATIDAPVRAAGDER
jgi:periplasmic copper chaperone A